MTNTPTHSEPSYEVVWPLGHRATQSAPLAPRLDTLDGKTVAFVWNHVFKGDEMFRIFEDAIRERYQNVTFVDHREFGNIHGTAAEEHEAVELLPRRLVDKGVDAAVVGVGA